MNGRWNAAQSPMFETPESSSDLKARQHLVKPPLVAPVWPIRVLAPNWPFTSSQGCCTGPGQPRRPGLPRPVCLLCVQRKKPTLNGSKSTCCTFSQVVGQKLFRTGSCHHRFQVKPLFISRSLLIVFFFFFGQSFLFCQRSGSVDTYQCLRVGNHVPGKQTTGLSARVSISPD